PPPCWRSRRPCPRSARRPRPADPVTAWRPRPRSRLTSRRSRGLGRGALAGEIGVVSAASEPKAQPPRKRSGKRTAKHTDAGKSLLRARRRSKAALLSLLGGAGISQASGQRGREDGGAIRFRNATVKV